MSDTKTVDRYNRGSENGTLKENNPMGFTIDDPKNQSLIQSVELEALGLVFDYLSGGSKYITAANIAPVLSRLGSPMNKRDIELMVWEVDEDNDGNISWEEFLVMYQRNIVDTKSGPGLEPKQLYFLTLFLMFENHEDRNGSISIEQTLKILYVRNPDASEMDREIANMFGEERERSKEGRPEDGYEQRISYKEFLAKMNTICNNKRNEKKVIGANKENDYAERVKRERVPREVTKK